MKEITVEEALAFAEENFPNAPERLIEELGIKVKYSVINTDGWCIQGQPPIIRINSNVPPVRQRFTLAHELGHLIYGITSVADEVISPFVRKNKEERKIDKFASELLLPSLIVLEKIKEIPITAKVLQEFAKKAKVSQTTVALRVASLASQLGLNNASVALYVDDEIKWQWSETLRMTGETPAEILAECSRSFPNPARIPHEQNEVIVASFAENPNFNTKILFLQLVNDSDGFKQLREEKLRDLEDFIFDDNREFRMSLQGCFGAFKSKVEELSLDEAIELFNKTHLKSSERWGEAAWKRLSSERGQEYIELRLSPWIKS
ncbi:MAG TPA: ImmA/IrrE family metallo-endopeptidase [Pyrinomonadaceae bacterium]|jgi:Zn-dependent peptidase ImmA (M78 family)